MLRLPVQLANAGVLDPDDGDGKGSIPLVPFLGHYLKAQRKAKVYRQVAENMVRGAMGAARVAAAVVVVVMAAACSNRPCSDARGAPWTPLSETLRPTLPNPTPTALRINQPRAAKPITQTNRPSNKQNNHQTTHTKRPPPPHRKGAHAHGAVPVPQQRDEAHDAPRLPGRRRGEVTTID